MNDQAENSLTCNNPNFIQQYFKQSRLHHLSTWKADLSEFVRDVMQGSSRIHRASTEKDYPRVIMHIDMDCFFASVGIRDRIHLKDKPVAVAHSTKGVQAEFSSSEIASCNYLARNKGVKNGMFIGSAKTLAPDLIIIPYEFDKYDACSRELYRILIERVDFVQAVSCDEAYVDISFQIKQILQQEGILPSTLAIDTSVAISSRLSRRIEELSRQYAEEIRTAIFEHTHCTASVGISHNLLLARVATARAKPNGCYFLSQESAIGFVSELKVRDLPGIGWATAEKCAQLQIATCSDVLQHHSLAVLQREFGERTGLCIWEYVHGKDDRVLENKVRQTIGAEINWGIRFTVAEQIPVFFQQFCEEVYNRMHSAGWMAKHITVTAKKKLYEGEPGKFLGCGHCQDISRSIALSQHITSVNMLYKHVMQLFKEMALLPTDIRGLGIHLKKLQRKTGHSTTNPFSLGLKAATNSSSENNNADNSTIGLSDSLQSSIHKPLNKIINTTYADHGGENEEDDADEGDNISSRKNPTQHQYKFSTISINKHLHQYLHQTSPPQQQQQQASLSRMWGNSNNNIAMNASVYPAKVSSAIATENTVLLGKQEEQEEVLDLNCDELSSSNGKGFKQHSLESVQFLSQVSYINVAPSIAHVQVPQKPATSPTGLNGAVFTDDLEVDRHGNHSPELLSFVAGDVPIAAVTNTTTVPESSTAEVIDLCVDDSDEEIHGNSRIETAPTNLAIPANLTSTKVSVSISESHHAQDNIHSNSTSNNKAVGNNNPKGSFMITNFFAPAAKAPESKCKDKLVASPSKLKRPVAEVATGIDISCDSEKAKVNNIYNIPEELYDTVDLEFLSCLPEDIRKEQIIGLLNDYEAARKKRKL